MSLDILNRLQQAQSEAERERLVLEFSLSQMPTGLQMAVKAAAIPHWFDVDYLNALLDSDQKEEFARIDGFRQLTQLSFIEPFPGRGFNVHERTGRVLREKMWEEEQDLYRVLSQRAAQYSATQNQDDISWKVETIYHVLLADTKEIGQFIFSSQCIQWNNSFEYEKIEVLLRPVLEAIKEDRLHGTTIAWAYFFQGSLNIQYSRNREAKSNLELASKHVGSDQGAEANVIQALGDVHVMLAEYSEARTRYEQALPIYQTIGDRLGEANVIKALGDVHVMLDEYSEARTRYEQALPIYQTIGDRLGEANVIQALGDLHGEMEQIAEAVSLLQDAAGRFKALGLVSPEAGCWNSMGNLWNTQKRFDEAIAAYNKAIELKPEAMWFRNRADTHIELKEFTAALEDLDQAEQLHPGQPYVSYHRGRIALWQQQVNQALLHLQEAVAMRPGNNVFQFWLAIAWLVNNHLEEARHTLQIALDLTYKEKALTDLLTELQEMAALYSSLSGFDVLQQTLEKAWQSFQKIE